MAFEGSAERRAADAAKQGGAGKRQEHGLPAPLTRDQNGRFLGSGNPRGRPKKRKVPPSSLAEACAQELIAPVTVGQNGKTVTLPTLEVLSKKLIADCFNGSAAERARALRSLTAIGAFQALADLKAAEAARAMEQCGNPWTAELEAKYQLLDPSSFDDADDDAASDVSQNAGTSDIGRVDAPGMGNADEDDTDAGGGISA